MTKLAPEWVRTSDPVIRNRWTTAPAANAHVTTLEVTLVDNPQDLEHTILQLQSSKMFNP